MSKAALLGPAGLFSTDDPAADQRQIEAEGWEGPETEQPDDLYGGVTADDFPEPIEVWGELIGCCACGWWDIAGYWEGDPASRNSAEEKLRAEHDLENTDCSLTVSISDKDW